MYTDCFLIITDKLQLCSKGSVTNHSASIGCRSPANIGTFAIDKTFFYEIGAYDEDMWGWGGDNVDLSIRVDTALFVSVVIGF